MKSCLQDCHHNVVDSGPNPRIEIILVKVQPKEQWTTVGAVEKPTRRPIVTVRLQALPSGFTPFLISLNVSQVKDYTWSDEKMGVRIWIKVPGVHNLRADAVTVRFRELSFDITVSNLHGNDFTFAVRT